MSLTQISADIYCLTVPVPFHGLRWVNCYLIQDEKGWAILDSGLNYAKARAVWTEALATVGIKAGDIQKIILTHIHADHFGLTGWLQQFNQRATPAMMSPFSIEVATLVWQEAGQNIMVDEQFWSMTGIEAGARGRWAAEFEMMWQAMQPYPDCITPIKPGETLSIGKRRFQIIDTPGHSDGHIALFDETNRLMLIGDQVLAHITPNIGFWPSNPPNPLERYLTSLHALRRLPVEVALPGHGEPITNWAGRIDAIIAHHAERLESMQQAVGDGATAYEVSLKLFEAINPASMDLQFAVTETLAHLEYLVHQQKLYRHDKNVWWYQNI